MKNLTPFRTLAVLLMVLALLGACRRGPQVARRVVLVSFDTLNLRFVDPYRSPGDAVAGGGWTPALSALAADGTLFERAYTPVPLTLPAHVSYLTGRDPLATRVMLNGDRLPDGLVTLPQLLGPEGYSTAAFVSLGVLSKLTDLHRGFDRYDDRMPPGRWYRTADEVLPAALDWIADHPDEPFFLWLHLSDPHEPYLGPDALPDTTVTFGGRVVSTHRLASKDPQVLRLEVPPGRHRLVWRSERVVRPDDLPSTGLRLVVGPPLDSEGLDFEWGFAIGREHVLRDALSAVVINKGDVPRTLALRFHGHLNAGATSEVLEQYADEVRFADRAFGELRRAVEELEGGESTLWAAVSDHGEGLRFHGNALGHATHVFEDQMRTLWMLAGPRVPVGRRQGDPLVRADDLAPTLLELLRLDVPPDMTGRSMVSCWRRDRCPPDEPFWGFGAQHRDASITALAAYAWPQKMISGDRRRFFALDTDPWESTRLEEQALTPAMLELVRRSARERARLSEGLQNRSRAAGGNEEMLRSLGYLGN